MSRGLHRRLAMLVLGAVGAATLSGCYGVYSYGYVSDGCEPCVPVYSSCGPSYVSRGYCPPAPVYVGPCGPVRHTRW